MSCCKSGCTGFVSVSVPADRRKSGLSSSFRQARPRRNHSARRSRAVRWTCSLPGPLQKHVDDLFHQSDSTSRYMHLVELGDALMQIPEKELVSSTRVPGCTSVTHVDVVFNQDDTVSLRGFSDARISRGLVALLVTGLDGQQVHKVLSLRPDEILSASGLHGSVSQTRINGLSAILHDIQRRLKLQQTGIGEANEVRWTDRAGPDVAVLLSGGVDSSVAMRLAQASGARVQAFYLKIWLGDELSHLGKCPWEDDMATARAVCEQAGVKLHDIPLQKEYWEQVVSYTVAETRAGRTPNPDVMCNSRIKFGAFLQHVDGFDKVVTGHYAQTQKGEKGTELWCSGDEVKDQTYFLAHLNQKQVSRAWFPIGRYRKEEVRELAREMGLVNQSRADSQGICFLGKVKFDDFLRHELGEQRGKLVEFETGQELGWHRGYWFFTAGQRRGVGLSGGPWYVVCKDSIENIVYVSRAYDAKEQARNEFDFVNPMWISGDWPEGLEKGQERRMKVKTRHGRKFHDAVVMRVEDGGKVRLRERDKGLAAGQFAAFYDYEGRCLGSGIIAADSSLRPVPKKICKPSMPPTLASPRRPPPPSDRPVTRARKRLRLSNPSLDSSKPNKRRLDEKPPPSVRKRRPSTAPTPPPAKRVRYAFEDANGDTEMTAPLPMRRARVKTLKDVLRSHRIQQPAFDIQVTPFVPSNVPKLDETEKQSDTRTQCSYTDQSSPAVHLTGDEEVDIIDISEASNMEQEAEANEENPLQAHLLEDGRCFVRIARPDGTIDYYTLNPHQ